GRIDHAIEQYETAATLGAEPDAYRQLVTLYTKVGRIDDASRAKARYEKALQGSPSGGTPR
ncbi:MAG: hypothetical protein ACRD2A_11205, partial [Vicinamibacterales bacterium]